MKTQVEINYTDQQYGQFVEGERGYIDGYVRGGENTPYAVVVITNSAIKYNKNRVVMVAIHGLNPIIK